MTDDYLSSFSQHFVQLLKAYFKQQRCEESPEIDSSVAIDWTGCIEKATEYPIAVGGCGELFMGKWIDISKEDDHIEVIAQPKVIIKDVRMLADEFHDEKAKRKKRNVSDFIVSLLVITNMMPTATNARGGCMAASQPYKCASLRWNRQLSGATTVSYLCVYGERQVSYMDAQT
jgi:hypothetical protein